MPDPLTSQDAVEAALVRPLTDQESNFIDSLLFQASALLRLAAPSIDDRMARYEVNPLDLTAVSPAAVESVLAGVIKQVLVNPNSLTSQSDTTGPFSHTESYALRGDPLSTSRGVLRITPDDLAVLFPTRKRVRAGTIRVRAVLAPRPVGRYGPLTDVAQAIQAVVTYTDGCADVQMSDIVGGCALP